MTHAITPVLGFDPDRRTTDPDHSLGTTVIGSDGYPYVYVQAGGAIAASQTDVAVNGSFSATDGTGTYVNTIAFASGEYGFVKSPVLVAPAS